MDAYQKASAVAESPPWRPFVRRAQPDPSTGLASQSFRERRFPERWTRRAPDQTAPVIVVEPTRETLAAVERQVHVLESARERQRAPEREPSQAQLKRAIFIKEAALDAQKVVAQNAKR